VQSPCESPRRVRLLVLERETARAAEKNCALQRGARAAALKIHGSYSRDKRTTCDMNVRRSPSSYICEGGWRGEPCAVAARLQASGTAPDNSGQFRRRCRSKNSFKQICPSSGWPCPASFVCNNSRAINELSIELSREQQAERRLLPSAPTATTPQNALAGFLSPDWSALWFMALHFVGAQRTRWRWQRWRCSFQVHLLRSRPTWRPRRRWSPLPRRNLRY